MVPISLLLNTNIAVVALCVDALKMELKLCCSGVYYNYDSSNSKYSDSIMADQMAGQWYLKACDLAQSPGDQVTQHTIANVVYISCMATLSKYTRELIA